VVATHEDLPIQLQSLIAIETSVRGLGFDGGADNSILTEATDRMAMLMLN